MVDTNEALLKVPFVSPDSLIGLIEKRQKVRQNRSLGGALVWGIAKGFDVESGDEQQSVNVADTLGVNYFDEISGLMQWQTRDMHLLRGYCKAVLVAPDYQAQVDAAKQHLSEVLEKQKNKRIGDRIIFK